MTRPRPRQPTAIWPRSVCSMREVAYPAGGEAELPASKWVECSAWFTAAHAVN